MILAEGSGLPADGDQVMGVEDAQAFQEQAQPPRKGCQPAGNGWREGNTLEGEMAAREGTPDLTWK